MKKKIVLIRRNFGLFWNPDKKALILLKEIESQRVKIKNLKHKFLDTPINVGLRECSKT